MTENVPEGIFRIRCRLSFSLALERITTAIRENGFRVFATIDHSMAATTVGLELRPTTVILFGNPIGGTPLMNLSRTIGIDLPSKILVIEESDATDVYFNLMSYIAERHGLTGVEKFVNTFDSKIIEILRGICSPLNRSQ